ncbi:MAG: hypothetical protein CLLPBCKN_000297 [Chroococcidiopsis cubana SAG 39.79]|jgi:hypothetical protein|uniref:Uncharacterized protein n=2 Tax=Chroococcidiopsis TaxID=54298 RepID=K9U2C1_CHRTP|nr:hypothetical protein [Chroococcidiopsis cubana]AFY89247.1 hypothetical protein Chro_3823 [Chroococcidiopsis thermalis PCC 7203]MDZ4870909.1 hypothetical protein [Chroococcidiopsis cubana SAG 39.79]PSB44280.1 hypothetical protein C7B80_21245 [Cyanosarcina cf. burmensis CCALA 770]PSB62670.1 hypothetical protein C7B79_17085 [Chroococcidiopsis cubana CCALA 043]
MKKFHPKLDKIHRAIFDSVTVAMTEPRPSNIIIKVFLAIALLFGFFALGAIINYASQQFQQNEIETEKPQQELLDR